MVIPLEFWQSFGCNKTKTIGVTAGEKDLQ